MKKGKNSTSSLTDEELIDAYHLQLGIKRDELQGSLYEFLKYFWDVICKEEFVDNWHIKYLCGIAQKAVLRVIARKPKLYDICINVSPGSSKSTIFSIMMQAWSWTVDPTLKHISASNEKELATDLCVKCRDVLKSDKFKELWGDLIVFKSDEDGKTAYSNKEGGGRRIATVGRNITGFHAHVLSVDDALNPLSAASEAEKKTANTWVYETLSNRKIDKLISLTFYIQQRLAGDDTTGHILSVEGDEIQHICLPAEIHDMDNVKPKSLKKFYKKGLFDPVRMPRKVLEASRKRLGGRGYSGQFLQYPGAIEGSIFKREYWQYYKELEMQAGMQRFQSWDTAFKDKQWNDFSCCTDWIVFKNGYYLVGFWMEKVKTPELKKQMILRNSAFKPHKILIEDKASGIVMIQELKNDSRLPIFGIKVNTDKVVRASDAVPTIEARNVYLPENEEWTAGLVDRLAMFPDAKHDDDADSITQFLNYIRTGSGVPIVHSRKFVMKSRGF